MTKLLLFTMPWRQIRKVLLWLIALILLVLIAVSGATYLMCLYRSDLVSSVVESQLSQETGLFWQLQGNVEPRLFPRPGIIFNDVRVFSSTEEAYALKKHPLFSVNSLQIEPDFFDIALGRLNLGIITLVKPHVLLTEETSREVKNVPSSVAENSFSVVSSSFLPGKNIFKNGTHSTFVNNDLQKDTKNTALIGLEECLEHLRILIQSDRRKYISQFIIQKGYFAFLDTNDTIIVAFDAIQANLFVKKGRRSQFSATMQLPMADLRLSFNGEFRIPHRLHKNIVSGSITIDALLSPPESRDIPLQFETTFFWRSDDNFLVFPKIQVASEGDSVSLVGEINPASEFFAGQLSIMQLSLPRWFMFARNLPPGLQDPLHRIEGKANVKLGLNSTFVTNINAIADTLPIKGELEVVDFSTPIIKVDVDLDAVDLDAVFPFLAIFEKKVVEPEEPVFSMPYLIPYPGPGGDELPDVGYDINVRLAEGTLHSLVGGPLEVKVFPIENDVTRVVFSCLEWAQGKVTGQLDIDRHSVQMHYSLNKVNLALLPENDNASVIFSGKSTAEVDLSVTIKNGKWLDPWGVTGEGVVELLSVANPKEGWHLSTHKTTVDGKGVIYTARKEGLRLDGVWNAAAAGIFTSWNPKGLNDALTGTLKGVLAWPPENSKTRGMYHIYGGINTSGLLTVPLGAQLVPVKGKLHSGFDWRIDTGLVKLESFAFDGSASYASGNLDIDSSKDTPLITGKYSFKLSPQVLLPDWGLGVEAIKVPEIVTGNGQFHSAGTVTSFDKLDMQIDGAPVKGFFSAKRIAIPSRIKGKGTSRLLLDMDFIFERLDLDKYIVASIPEELTLKPNTTPWDLSFLTGIDITGKYEIKKGRFRKADFSETQGTIKLEKEKLSVVSRTSNIYDGKGTINLQGIVDPIKSTLAIRKLLIVLKGASLGQALQDLSGEEVYGGIADMAADLQGLMHCSADMPAALSGAWSMEVRDGVYSAFLGSKTAGLRNTFSMATVSGVMEKGIMRWDNFLLKGSMVDMKGTGWIDLGKKNLDIDIMVAMASVPTAPVHFSGTFDKLEMRMSGSRLAIGAVPVAGASVFYLFRGILELPARAIRGVGDMFSSDEVKGVTYQPKEQ